MSTPAPHTPGPGAIQRRLIKVLQDELGLSDHDLDQSCRIATGKPLDRITRADAHRLIGEMRAARQMKRRVVMP